MAKSNVHPYVRYGLLGLAALAVFSVGKWILNRFGSGFALLSSSKDQKNIAADLNSPLRQTFVRGVVDSLRNEMTAFNQSESDIVDLLNSLGNGEEVQYASAYYRNAHGVSLKSDVQKSLDSWANPIGWFTSSHWGALKDYVKNNLV
jgi:hypothetical protein